MGRCLKFLLRAAQAAIEWKKFPQRVPDEAYFDVPNRIRASIAELIGAKADEIALTTGASTGMAAVAYGLSWKPVDEVITAQGRVSAGIHDLAADGAARRTEVENCVAQ